MEASNCGAPDKGVLIKYSVILSADSASAVTGDILASAKMSMQRTLHVIQSERRYSEPCILCDCSLVLKDVKYHHLSLSRPS